MAIRVPAAIPGAASGPVPTDEQMMMAAAIVAERQRVEPKWGDPLSVREIVDGVRRPNDPVYDEENIEHEVEPGEPVGDREEFYRSGKIKVNRRT